MQIKSFEANSKKELAAAIIAVLQDVGYKVGETNLDLGVVKATKEADAKRAGEIALTVGAAILTGSSNAVDDNQRITVSIVIYSTLNTDMPQTYQVRAIFAQEVFKTNGFKSKAASIEEEEIYKEFFDKLSSSLFIEENKI
ncbi:hypothetical protein N9Z31_05900 [Pseudomonadales bacterium]|nr:hypothetical protein [Pseudomonadales bacterium]